MNIILAWVTKLFSNPKLLAIILAVLLCFYGAYKVHHAWTTLHEQVATSEKKAADAIKEQHRLENELNIAVGVNKSNQAIIDQMQADKLLNQKRINELNSTIADNNKSHSVILNNIHNSDKADDGPVAKVLKDTLRALQNKGDKK